MTKEEFNIQKALGLINSNYIFTKCPRCKIETVCKIIDGHFYAPKLYKVARITFLRSYVNGCSCTICNKYLRVKVRKQK